MVGLFSEVEQRQGGNDFCVDFSTNKEHFCTNGGLCVDTSPPSCLCPPAYTGLYCELDKLDEVVQDVQFVPGAGALYCGPDLEEVKASLCGQRTCTTEDDYCLVVPAAEVGCSYVDGCITTPRTPVPTLSPTYEGTYEYEYEALTREFDILDRFYRANLGDGWTRRDYWTSDISFCDWHGVTCHKGFEYDTVRKLNLEGNGIRPIRGVLDLGWLAALPNLEVVSLGKNELRGTVREIEGGFPSLKVLDLSENLLKGPVPMSFGRLPALETLDLSHNMFTSFLKMGNSTKPGYPKLTELKLRYNLLDGASVLLDAMQLPSLETLDLRHNKLVGPLPPMLTSVPGLKSLDLSSNFFVGPLGVRAGKHLTHFNISHNQLSGEIQPEFLIGFPSMKTFDLSHNAFSGKLPNLRSNHLSRLYIVGNEFTSLDEEICGNIHLNNGDVARYGCDGLACPVLKSSPMGRHTAMMGPCKPCENATFIGSVECFEGIDVTQDEGSINNKPTTKPTTKPSKPPLGVNETESPTDLPTLTPTLSPTLGPTPVGMDETSFPSLSLSASEKTSLQPSSSLEGMRPSTAPVSKKNFTFSPSGSMNTFGMYELPTFFLALVARDTTAALASVAGIEEVAGKFLFAVFNDSLDVDDSIFIASLKASEVDEGIFRNLNSSSVRTLQPAGDQVRYFDMKVSIFVRDGSLPKSNIKTFIWSNLREAFQSTEDLLSLLRETSTFSSISKVELTYKIEICPSGDIRCQHGSVCSTSAGGNSTCDCSTSMFTVDGMQCEYIATDLCTSGVTTLTGSNSSSPESFCVNGGTCMEKNISLEEQSHPACNCPLGYEGSRCEQKKEVGPQSENEHISVQIKNRDTTDESQIVKGLSNTLFLLIVGVGGAVILLAALILGYKIKRRRKAPDEPSDLEPLPTCMRNGVDDTGRTAPSSEEHDTFEENASPLYSRENQRLAPSQLD